MAFFLFKEKATDMEMKGSEMNKYRKMLEDLFEKAELKEKAKDIRNYILRTREINGIDDINQIRRLMERSGMIEPREYASVKQADKSEELIDKASGISPRDTKSIIESMPSLQNDFLQDTRPSDKGILYDRNDIIQNPNLMSEGLALRDNQMNANNSFIQAERSDEKKAGANELSDNGVALSDDEFRMVLAYLKNHLG